MVHILAEGMSGSLDLREPADEVEGTGYQEEEVGEDCLSRLPIHPPLLERSPHSILWHKVGLEQRATNDTAIEQEIKMKLSFLQKIYKKRREGSWTGMAGLEVDMRTLELGLQDRCRQLEEAGRRMVEMRDAIAALQLEVGKAEKAKEELERIGEDNDASEVATFHQEQDGGGTRENEENRGGGDGSSRWVSPKFRM